MKDEKSDNIYLSNSIYEKEKEKHVDLDFSNKNVRIRTLYDAYERCDVLKNKPAP